MIEIRSLCFGYDKGMILQDINLAILKNTFISIIGPNGGGKSTFLKLLIGLLNPTSGTIEFKNYSSSKNKPIFGYVPQITTFDKEFPISTIDVVLGGGISQLPWHGHFTSKLKKQAKEALEKLDLLSFENVPFGDLSGGQAQRVLIARALMHHPQILVLDEPTASVDKEAKHKIYNLLKSLKGTMTILLVTHETPGMIPYSDRVFCIQKNLTELNKATVCGHFAFGVYHETT